MLEDGDNSYYKENNYHNKSNNYYKRCSNHYTDLINIDIIFKIIYFTLCNIYIDFLNSILVL